jgi:DDE family transposase
VVDQETITGALGIFLAALPPEIYQNWRKAAKLRQPGGVFTTQLVIWLMMRQSLDPKGTLNYAVQDVLEGGPGVLLPSHKRLREGTLSSDPSAYGKACKRLKAEEAKQASTRIFNYLMSDMQEALPGLGRQAFLIDGSSLTLSATRELVKAYPPAENQHGTAHYPIVRVVVAHDLVSGIAIQPCWGPMYGEAAVSEQELAVQAMDQLPPRSVVVWDRNFGVFYVTYHATQREHPVVVRLTEARVRALLKLKGKLPQQIDQTVDWTPSRYERRVHPDLPPDACVRGRVIACLGWKHDQSIQLYLFTTLDLPVEQNSELYGYRWNIETDLRSLKRTVNLHTLDSQSVEMVAKELVLGVAAYNLVRGTMYAAARVAGIDPRQLSFSRVQDVVRASLPRLTAALSPEEYQRAVDRVLKRAAQCKLPQRRSRRPAYPRAVWGHRNSFPKRR